MKKLIFIIIIALFSACSTNTVGDNYVRKSLYLNKPLLKFEMDNGFCKSRKTTSDGGYLNYYSSDSGNIFANLQDFDSYPPCQLAIKTDKDGIIRAIKIIENDIKCAYILK